MRFFYTVSLCFAMFFGFINFGQCSDTDEEEHVLGKFAKLSIKKEGAHRKCSVVNYRGINSIILNELLDEEGKLSKQLDQYKDPFSKEKIYSDFRTLIDVSDWEEAHDLYHERMKEIRNELNFLYIFNSRVSSDNPDGIKNSVRDMFINLMQARYMLRKTFIENERQLVFEGDYYYEAGNHMLLHLEEFIFSDILETQEAGYNRAKDLCGKEKQVFEHKHLMGENSEISSQRNLILSLWNDFFAPSTLGGFKDPREGVMIRLAQFYRPN